MAWCGGVVVPSLQCRHGVVAAAAASMCSYIDKTDTYLSSLPVSVSPAFFHSQEFQDML